MDKSEIPRCFISYSWDNEQHRVWVRKLATRLRESGVDAILDQFHCAPGMDLAKFMEKSVRESDFVLLVCSPNFSKKADTGVGGVGYEKTIVTGEIFAGEARETKFVPLLREGDAKESLPSYLKSRLFVDFREDASFESRLEELLRHFYGEPLYPPPPIGHKPQFRTTSPPVEVEEAAFAKNEQAERKAEPQKIDPSKPIAGTSPSEPAPKTAKPLVKSLPFKLVIPVAFAVVFVAVAIVLFRQEQKKSIPDVSSPYDLKVGTIEEPQKAPEPAAKAPKPEPAVVAKPSEPSPSKKFTNSIGMEFVLIPAGSFTMGSRVSPKELVSRFGGDEKWFENEQPPHDVKISQSFYLQATEVTQGQWKKVMGDNPSYFNQCGDDCPVEVVSWEGAQRFIEKLNQLEKTQAYRLPSEAEWEYACRAGTTTEYSYGDDAGKLGEYAWYGDNSSKTTQRVAGKKPNPWGLYDMHGNVWEWVEDDWHVSYKGAPADGRAWVDNPRGSYRVMRGGSWLLVAHYCRSARRLYYAPDDRNYYVGFRLSRSVALGP